MRTKSWRSVIPLTIVCFGCMLFALGQGGTGRLPSNANAKKNPAPSKPPSSRKIKPRRSTAPPKKTNNEAKADDAVAIERTYWERIRVSSNPEDFKAYLKKYPKGQFAGLARNSLQRLETRLKPPSKTNTNSASPNSGSSTPPVPKPGSIVRDQLGMELVYVPAGSFMMGSNNGPNNEKPVHQVTIKEGFYMGRYEVTQAQWKQVMGNNPSYFKGDNLPVEQVTWGNAVIFTQKALGNKFGYRLPTEAEWEYACRAGTTGDYAGDLTEMAWFSDNSERRTHGVGGKRPNAWGLFDMHGNVWEWCDDVFHESYVGAPTNGSAWWTGATTDRVLRGGSWVDPAGFLRSAFRLGNRSQTSSCGFRVVAFEFYQLGPVSVLSQRRE